MRTTSGEPAQVCIVLPAQWIAGLDHATELVRQQNPRMPAPPVKYVHPVLGETWSGRGRLPIWVNAWLEAGNTLESLLPAAAEKSIEVENSDRASAAEDQHDAKAIETNETPIADVRP